MRLNHGELSGWLTSRTVLWGLLRGCCFGGISCISVYLCISFRAVPQQKTWPFWNRDPSCAPQHCSFLCFVHKISKGGQLPQILSSCHSITMFRSNPTFNRKKNKTTNQPNKKKHSKKRCFTGSLGKDLLKLKMTNDCLWWKYADTHIQESTPAVLYCCCYWEMGAWI